jgi:hypothetical protein
MPETIPSPERLRLIEHGDRSTDFPVLALAVVDGSLRPLLLAGCRELLTGDALTSIDDGWVMDLTSGEVFDDASDFFDSRPEYQLGEPFAKEKRGRPSNESLGKPAPAGKKTVTPVGPFGIAFGLKTYAKNSTWKYEDADGVHFVLALDGGKGIPLGQGIEKITREEYQQHKNVGVPALTLAQVKGEAPIDEFDHESKAEVSDDEAAAMSLV